VRFGQNSYFPHSWHVCDGQFLGMQIFNESSFSGRFDTYFCKLVSFIAVKHYSGRTLSSNSMFFAFSFIIEGATEKVLQFSILIMPILKQNLGFDEKVCNYEHYREVQTIKNQLIDIDLVMKIFF
jgi:hypothetical protein